MRVNEIKTFFLQHGLQDHLLTFDQSSATVELAAKAVGCAPEHIVKTLVFKTKMGPVLICAAGNVRVDNHKYKAFFGEKAAFALREEVETLTGHPAGGVCPFALPEGVGVYLDESIRSFAQVYPAAGAVNNAVRLTPQQLQQLTGAPWIDVCKKDNPCAKR